MTTTDAPVRIHLSDFFTGFFATLALNNVRVVLNARSKGFHKAVQEAFTVFEKINEDAGYKLNFVVILNQFHGDSDDIYQGMADARLRNVFTWDSPEFCNARLRIVPEYAKDYLATVDGVPESYEAAADKFLDLYQTVK